METKKCSKCLVYLSLSSFYQRSTGKSYHSACKKCEKEMAKKWYEKNKEYAKKKVKEWRATHIIEVKKYRNRNRLETYKKEISRKYGIEYSWFDITIEKQNGKCAICKRVFEYGIKQRSPHVDHSHITGKVRGILCNRCNTVLGLCEDNPALFIKMKEYLRICHG